MTDDNPLHLASLLCSRLCHDLLSPVGALTNGLELLRDERDPDMRARCLELLEASAAASANKLKFFRLAFGAAGGFDEEVPTDEPRSLIDALLAANARIEAHWSIPSPTLPKPAVKLLLNLAQIGMDALVRGGTLDIGAESRADESEIVVRATGPRIAFDPQIGKALDGALASDEITSRTAPATMVSMIAFDCGGQVQYAQADGQLVLGAVLPRAED